MFAWAGNVLISFRRALTAMRQSQIDEQGEIFQSVVFMEARINELDTLVKEIHAATVKKK